MTALQVLLQTKFIAADPCVESLSDTILVLSKEYLALSKSVSLLGDKESAV
jgi:hypothetical protein